jgi:hypothetical protein
LDGDRHFFSISLTILIARLMSPGALAATAQQQHDHLALFHEVQPIAGT